MMRKYIIFLFLVFFVLLCGLVSVTQLSYSSADEDLVAVTFLEQTSSLSDADFYSSGELVDSDEQDQLFYFNLAYLSGKACTTHAHLFRRTQEKRYTPTTLFTELDLPPPSNYIS